jgi:iron complex outermembrane receptor protein
MKHFISIIILSSILNPIFSQNKISAYIIDSLTNKPVTDAQITNIATKKNTFSGYNGYFELPCQNIPIVIKITHIAYHTKIVRIPPNAKKINIYISRNQQNIKEINIFSQRIYIQNNNSTIPKIITQTKNIEKLFTPLSSYELLKQYANINIISPMGIFSNNPIITTAGAANSPGRTLILFDNIKINKSDDQNANWNMIPPNAIKYIEIIPLSSSSIYGNNAMTGAINLIPSIPQKKGLSGNAKIHYGNFNTYALELSTAFNHFSDKGFFFNINSFAQKSNGYINTPDSLQLKNIQYIPSQLKEAKINIISGYDFNRNQNIKLICNLFDDYRSLGEKIKEKNGSYTKHSAYFTILKYKLNLNKTSFHINLFSYYEHYFKNIEALKKNIYSLIYVNSIRQDAEFSSFINHNLKNKLFSSFGITTHYGSVFGHDDYQTSSDIVINSGQIITNDFFLHNSLRLLKNNNLIISAGINMNFSHTINPKFYIKNPTPATLIMQKFTGTFKSNLQKKITYSAGFRYKLKHLSFLGSYNTGFRTPQLEDLTRSGFMRLGFKIANPYLTYEYLKNSSTSILFSNKYINTNITFNYNIGNNFINFIQTGQTIFNGKKYIIQKQNITQVKMYIASASINIKQKNYGIFLNYTFNNSFITKFDSLPQLIGKKLIYSPQNILHTGIWIKIYNLTASTTLNYFSKQFTNNQNTKFIKAYKTLDAKIKVLLNKNLSLSFAVQNIFDYKYIVYYNQISIGRFMLLNLKYKF